MRVSYAPVDSQTVVAPYLISFYLHTKNNEISHQIFSSVAGRYAAPIG